MNFVNRWVFLISFVVRYWQYFFTFEQDLISQWLTHKHQDTKGWMNSLTFVFVQIKILVHKITIKIFSTCVKYVKYTKTFYANSVKQFSPFSKTIFTSTHIHTYWNDGSKIQATWNYKRKNASSLIVNIPT